MKKTPALFGLFGLLALISLPAGSANAQATRTWVSGVGDDVNPCSRTAPCKTFPGAISKTAAGGEIDCLDPGGFGTVTITKSITIDCGANTGGILSTGTSAGVIVNAGAADKIVLRNLLIQGSNGGTPATNGVRFLAGLELDRVAIIGYTTTGVDVNKTAQGILSVRNSYFAEGANGIKLLTTVSNITASISNTSFNNLAANGVEANTNSFANVSNSVFSTIGGSAMLASASPPSLALIGAVLGDADAIAVFVDRTNQKMVRLRQGESHAGWVLSTVLKREVTLKKDDRTETIELKSATGPAAMSGTNGAPLLPAPTAIGAGVMDSNYAPFTPRSTPKNGESDGL